MKFTESEYFNNMPDDWDVWSQPSVRCACDNLIRREMDYREASGEPVHESWWECEDCGGMWDDEELDRRDEDDYADEAHYHHY